MTDPTYYVRLMAEHPAPCDCCPSYERCRIEQLACAAYSCYVMQPYRKPRNHKDRNPTREIYSRLFPRDDA